MLLEFRTKNFKSFRNEAVFSMTAAPKQKGLDYSLMKEKSGSKIIKGLSSSVVYGPNAAGKTNIIGSMDVLRSIVIRGNIKNTEGKSSPNYASSALELIPNNSLSTPEPVSFSVTFFEKGFKIKYGIDIDLGTFLDSEYERRIVFEQLTVNDNEIFTRKDGLTFGKMDDIKEYLINQSEKEGSIEKISENSLNPEELFLTNGFKLIYSQSFVKLITDWFNEKFMVIYRADSMQIIKRFADPQKETVYIETTTNEAAKLFGINSNAVGYVVSDDSSEAKLYSIFNNIKDSKNAAIAAEFFESYGTIRFINMFPLVIRALQRGGTLVVDEFDASIHPMALMNIINAFHNDDININHAQLIFNTHNPIFLNSNLFRRDEIKFVERDDDTHYGTLYSLSDFGTAGEAGVRKNDDYMKNYFIDRYGAIKNIDFTPIFEEIVKNKGEI